jgi:hypothetical protein
MGDTPKRSIPARAKKGALQAPLQVWVVFPTILTYFLSFPAEERTDVRAGIQENQMLLDAALRTRSGHACGHDSGESSAAQSLLHDGGDPFYVSKAHLGLTG